MTSKALTSKVPGRVPGKIVRQHPWSLRYFKLRLIALVVRSFLRPLQELGYLLEPAIPQSIVKEKITVPSRDPKRTIRVHVYRPRSVKSGQKLPIHINFHGSGFVLPSLGQDSFFCSQLASRFGGVVLDSDYSKGPERPYPAGVEDAEDVAAWAASHPSTLPPLDLSRLTLSGFSAGGNIALVLSLKLGPERCSAVSVLYPPTEMHLPTENVQEVWRTPPNPNFKYGVRLPRPVNIFFRQAYIVEGTDDNVPWISPLNAEADQFPKVVHVTCGDGDKLHDDGQKLITKLNDAGHPDATFNMVKNGGHGFDKAQRSAEGEDMRDEAYEQVLGAIGRGLQKRT